MESTKKKLADWMDISDRNSKKQKLNPIDKFLLDNEVAGIEASEKFRKELLKAINFEDEESRLERNSNTIASFMEHCKENGVKIPDKLFESFFEA